MRSPATPTIRHLPALDGLRGIALIGVLLFHANGALTGGYLGVDLFFVLSGFLITSLLLTEHRATGSVALGAFWIRRARRLLPALLGLMPAIALYGRALAAPDELRSLRADALATLAYVANWHAIASHASYWDLFAAPSPLEHTWSLAVEGQFYVVWPLVVVVLLRHWGKRSVLAVSIALGAASMVAMALLVEPGHASRAYLGTDTRAAGLLAGAALAAVLPLDTTFGARAQRFLDLLGMAAAAGLGLAWAFLDGEDMFLYRGGLWLTEVGALALIACAIAGPKRSLVARALSFRPLVLLGTISYGVYLWHWPIDVVMTAERTHVHGVMLHAVRFAVTIVVAVCSYRFVERPIRSSRLPVRRPLVMASAAVALSIVLVVRATEGDASAAPGQRRGRTAVTTAGAASKGAPAVGPDLTPVRFRVMLVGDSTANSLGWALRGLREPGLAVDLRGQDGCTMLADLCGGPKWAAATEELHPDSTLVVLAGAFMHGLGIDGQWRKACHPGWDATFEAALRKRLGSLTAPGVHVFATTIPFALGVWETPAFHDEVTCINASIRRAVRDVADVQLLDVAGYLCPDGECLRDRLGVPIRPDGVHYAIDGAADLARWVLSRIDPKGARTVGLQAR